MEILILITVAVCIFGLSACAISEKALKTTEYTLKSQTSAPITVAVVSDLHFSRFGKDNKRLVDAVKKMNPDAILLAGDFFDYHHQKSNKDAVVATMKAFCKIAPTYMCPGNHDMRYNVLTGENCLDYARNSGVKVLDGEYADTVINGQNVRIGGIFDYSVYAEDYGERWNKSDVYAYLKNFEQTDALKLLLMHRPNTFIYTDDEWNIDAVFCGHDHGGIWRLPFIGGVYAPEQGFFPEYDKGEYNFGKMKMFLCAGLEGYYWVPRVFNRAEILKISINE
ncbi:MAG: metallophosphoesterase [Clostridia bacterium]|nr:metallophosphoesterase [Clostridia bacterium]